jgi:4-hydroxythreonine-4-phosphate dehydrogenase
MKAQQDSSIQSRTGRTHPILAVSMGDMNGIGPEVILKMLPDLARSSSGNKAGVLLFADREVMLDYFRTVSPYAPPPTWLSGEAEAGWSYGESSLFPSDNSDMPVPGPAEVVLVPSRHSSEPAQPGRISAFAGKLSMDAVAAGIDACLSGKADALVTGPISKEAIHLGGFNVPGHTEYLAERTGANDVGMMLVNNTMRIGLVTIHVPLRVVPGLITASLINTRLKLYNRTLVKDFGITRPRIAVLGLNPHSGDGGVLGSEEQDIIEPVLEKVRNEGLDVTGPWPADGFFGSGGYREVDLVLAMYHDQGLIPLKLAGFGGGVNVTAGLPIIRTSPDHGTAFSLAGKNEADARSMLEAALLALDMIRRRQGKTPEYR